MGYVSRHDHALLDFRLSLPEDWARDAQRREECHVPPEEQYHTRHAQCLEMLAEWAEQVPHGWVTGDDELGRHTRFRHDLRERGERYKQHLDNLRWKAPPASSRDIRVVCLLG